MKQIHYFIFCLLAVAAISLSSCEKDKDKVVQPAITNQSWQEGVPVEITPNETLTVTFNAAAKWRAGTNSIWCEILNKSGNAGKSTLQLLTKSGTTTDRTSEILITVEGYDKAVSFQVTQKAGEVPQEETEDMKVNTKVAEYLRKNYLWNDEYKTMPLDYTKNYEDFFYGTLEAMKTNTLDRSHIPETMGTPTIASSLISKRKIPSPRPVPSWWKKNSAIASASQASLLFS